MTGTVLIDTNLLVLLIVGLASPAYIAKHKRLHDYTIDDFDMINLLIAGFSEILTLPHVLAEVSSFVTRVEEPAKMHIQTAFQNFVQAGAVELPATSLAGSARPEFTKLGLTDAVILHVCALDTGGTSPTLLTADSGLADSALSLGYRVIDYRREYKAGL